ncbi:hypothetical protein M404DRAFT_417719 [Pisolithus tinctorius Marx 270]|uniref:Uncharacterized protein n=1 Tax=Pisolithus tinctorius Marx 270 TaxID=870435 RepID=A0A0C3P1F0_PISTI|nr:hypothetical protein M404DRAFT_417719 [Pisolithus tinctorius Marx 270]
MVDRRFPLSAALESESSASHFPNKFACDAERIRLVFIQHVYQYIFYLASEFVIFKPFCFPADRQSGVDFYRFAAANGSFHCSYTVLLLFVLKSIHMLYLSGA